MQEDINGSSGNGDLGQSKEGNAMSGTPSGPPNNNENEKNSQMATITDQSQSEYVTSLPKTEQNGNPEEPKQSFFNKLEEFKDNLGDLDYWKETMQPRVLEISMALFFLVGVTLTALIASGVLALGSIWLGVFATLGFLGASHFFGTASWTRLYYDSDCPNDSARPCLKEINETVSFITSILKLYVLPLVFALGGIALVVLGSMGILGLGLGLGLGIPSIVASLSWFIIFFNNDLKDPKKEGFMRRIWTSYIAVVGMLAAATFLILGFAGILAWPSVLAFGLPAAFAAIIVPTVGILIKSTEWVRFRGRVEELLEPVLFLGGITLTVLISLGILPLGGVGIAICSMLTFFGASRFLATNSWSRSHNCYSYEGRTDYPTALISSVIYYYDTVSNVKFISAVIGVIAGFALSILGATGIFGLGLGLALGIPIFSASLIGLASIYMYRKDSAEYKIDKSDNVWGNFTAILGVIAAVASLVLGFGGFLALPVALTIAIPSIAVSLSIGVIHLAMFLLSKAKGCETAKRIFGNKGNASNKVGCLGIGRYELKYPLEKKEEDKPMQETTGNTVNYQETDCLSVKSQSQE